MKKTQCLQAILCLCVLLITSCSKKEESPASQQTTNVPEGVLKAKLNGEMKTADMIVKAVIYDNTQQVLISGTGMEGGKVLQFSLAIGDFKGLGTYPLAILDSRGLGTLATYLDGKLGGYECVVRHSDTRGEVKITEYTAGKSLKGSFKFNAKKVGVEGTGPANAEFTDGVFNIKL
jgi:hypothetical protein